MTKEEREELVQQKENLKLLFEFHTGNRVIKEDPQFEQYINDILDMSRMDNGMLSIADEDFPYGSCLMNFAA